MQQKILLYSALVLPEYWFCLSSLKYLKIISTDFIFRQMRILMTTRIVRLNSGHYVLFLYYLKNLTMRLCTLCKIVSMSKQYSGTVGLKTKINLATRYYIIKGSFKPSQSETERHFFRHFCCVANLSFFTGKPEP